MCGEIRSALAAQAGFSCGFFARLPLMRRAYCYWLSSGIVGRLYVPIFLLVLLFSGVRYSLLIETTSEEIGVRTTREMRELGHFLLPRLVQVSPGGAVEDVRGVLTQELRNNPSVASIRWENDGLVVEVANPQLPAAVYPSWFSDLVPTRDQAMVYPATHGNPGSATLVLTPSSTAAVNSVWKTLMVQVRISAGIIFTIFFLLTLILRSNGESRRRLAQATDRFKAGDYSARMQITGSAEAQAMARTFNAMAQEVQTLVQSVQASECQQREQLHFMLQLINAFPVPLCVVNPSGVCQRVNTAWEQLFRIPAAQIVGQPLQALLDSMQMISVQTGHMCTDAETSLAEQELHIVAPDGRAFDALYWQAAFTTTDGNPAGTIGAMMDITLRRQAQVALRAEKERAEVTLSSIGDAVITTDLGWRIESINTVAQQLTGWTADQAQGCLLSNVFELMDVPGQTPQGPKWSDVLSLRTVVHADNQVLVSHVGQHFAVEYTASPIAKTDGSPMGCVLVFRDVSEKRYLMQQISWLAYHDELTGLNNRSGLREHFQRAISQAKNAACLQGVCLIDLDHFQRVNDQLGSAVGNHLLREVALRLGHLAAKDDKVARLGGDEFVLLIGGQSELDAIAQGVNRVLADIARPYAINGSTIHLTASVGVAVFPHDGDNPDTLLRHADQALYQAKQSGRNGSHFFDATLDREVETRHIQRNRIQRAVSDGELRLYFQPKVNMRVGEVCGMEALLRWQHPEQGLLGPLHFLPQVENDDVIIEIGEWVLHQALLQLRSWLAQGKHWRVSVNIAARHFQLQDFVDRLKSVLSSFSDVPPRLLEIEVLESAALEDIQHVCNAMLECQALGVSFALDDFGTGYSSLAYLKRLPADTLKVDQSFVRDMLDNADDRALVSAVIGLARAFNRRVIAEGVESTAHGVQLIRMGCDFAQGYGVARPMPADAVLPWAHSYRPAPEWTQTALLPS